MVETATKSHSILVKVYSSDRTGLPEPTESEPCLSDLESFGSTRKVKEGSVGATIPVGARKHNRLRLVGAVILS